MNRKTRTALFLIFLLLFSFSAFAAIFYSQGYRIDFKKKEITQTGAFYFKVLPRGAEVYLNGKLKKKTDIFFSSAFIENLLPRFYKVEIKKKGYLPWKKDLEIKKREVTEAKNIVLIPENPAFATLIKGVEDVFPLAEAQGLAIKENTNEGWRLKFYDFRNNLFSSLIDEKDISTKKSSILEVRFSPDDKKVLLVLNLNNKLKYFILDLEKHPPESIPLGFLGSNLKNISFNPGSSQEIFFIRENKDKLNKVFSETLSRADLENKKISKVFSDNIKTYSLSQNNIYWLSNDGFLFQIDFSGENRKQLSFLPFPVKKNSQYKLFVKSGKILLKEDNNLYIFDPDTKNFRIISKNVNKFRFSPDSKKIVYFNDYEIWILFLEEKLDQPKKKVGEKMFLTRFSEKIGDCFWFTNHYLIFSAGDKIKITEIDDRDGINIVDLSTKKIKEKIKNPRIFWSGFTKKLYILNGKTLLASERLAS